jgi:hypothetical protein
MAFGTGVWRRAVQPGQEEEMRVRRSEQLQAEALIVIVLDGALQPTPLLGGRRGMVTNL